MEAFVPLAKPDLGGNEEKYLRDCIKTGYLTHKGSYTNKFELALSEFLGQPALTTSSGTAALHLALLALGIGRGDEVIVPNVTFGATASVVLAVGAKPILVDIDPETWGPSPDQIIKVRNMKTVVLMVVHLYGRDAGDYSRFQMPVVEDSCEAFGVVPQRGKYACYSFYGNKFISTGEGGCITGDIDAVRPWRDGGFDENYKFHIPGLNYRMTNLQAAVGCAQMERAQGLMEKRLRNAEMYTAKLRGKGKWLFVAEVEDPQSAAEALSKQGIETRFVFPPLHRNPAFRDYARGKYKNSEHLYEHGLCLPTGPHVTEKQVEKIIGILNGY